MDETDATAAACRELRRHRDAIVDAWALALDRVPDSQYHRHDPGELRDWAGASLDAIVDRISTGDDERFNAYVGQIGRVRRELGFDVGEVVEGLLLLGPAVHEVLGRSGTTSRERIAVVDEHVTPALRQLARRFASEYATGMRRSLQDERMRTQALLEETRRQLAESQSLQEVVTATLDKVGAPAMVEIVGRGAREITGAGGAAVILQGPDGTSSIAFASGSAAKRRNALSAHAERLVSGNSRVEIEAAIVEFSGSSLLTLPLRSGDRRIGAVVILDLPPGFGKEGFRVARVFADQAAVAIVHEQLHWKSERMLVLEERQKLARELHDSATQSIYGVSMYAEAANRLLAAGNVSGASGILGEIRDTALDALREMRLLIYELRPRTVSKDGLAAAIEARLTAVERRSGLQTEFVRTEIGTVSREASEAIHGIAREALNNVLKHARATRITVRLEPVGEDVRLEIEDDGQGFDVDATRRGGGVGLAGMEERASGLGGRLTIESRPGEGTRIGATVPRERDDRAP